MAVAAQASDQVVQHRGWFIFLSVLLIVAGAAAIAFPVLSTFAVELWAAIAFAFWLLLGGIVGIVLGVMIWQQLPSSALSVLGLLLGINLVFSGITFLMLAMSGAAATTAAA